MTGELRSETLGDVLALALAEHGPTGAERLAGVVHRRKGDVLDTLRTDPRFVRSGRGNQVRWWFDPTPAEGRKDARGAIPTNRVGYAIPPPPSDRWAELATARRAALARRYGEGATS